MLGTPSIAHSTSAIGILQPNIICYIACSCATKHAFSPNFSGKGIQTLTGLKTKSVKDLLKPL